MKTNVNSGMVIVSVLVLTISLIGTAKAANYLEITPADDFEPSGETGGPFTPSSKDYELRNKGQNSLYWGADKTVDWLVLDQTWGQLEPHESTIVTVSLTSEANSLVGGIYTDTLTFTDITNGEEETRGVVLTVNPTTEGVLEVTPIENFEPSGEIGGPFTPSSKDYQLTNSGGSLLYWGAAKTTNWLNLDPEWGSLDPCESTTVTVTLTSEANSLGDGIYTDTLTFTDLTNAVEQTREVTLTITVLPIWISPGSFDVNIIEGLSLTEMLTIGNNTLEDLNFLIRTRQVGGSGGSGEKVDSGTTVGKDRIFSVPKGHDFTAVGEAPYKPGELIVRFASKADGKLRSLIEKNQILSSLGGGNIKRDFKIVPGLSVVELPAGMTVEEALLTFNEANGILYAQPNYELKALSTFPDDPRFDELWGMHNMGQTGGTVDADIDAPEAWDIATGSSEIVVAVIDTGVDYTHPDLAANMWVNEAEFNGAPGFDDDGNGYVDDIYGYDFRNNDADPMDDHYHGTHCAGTIGAVGNNSEGVAGVCWNVRIMALKFLSSGGSGWTSDAILCIEYSVLMGANLSSNSWGGGGYNQGLKDAIDAAGADGMLFVASAGNDGANNDTHPHYPSSYDCESLIAVMATDSDDERSVHPGWASNYGQQTVDIGAPGSSILSCEPGGRYGHHSGTSMASPHVSGACALVWSMNPAMSNGEIKDILLRTVDPTLPGLCVSEGRLNLYSAILETKVPWLRIEPEAGTVGPGDSNDISVTFDAIEMAAGTYRAEIIIISSDPGHPPKVVPVTMTVNPDDLAVTPAEGFESSGTKGGPFTPECTTYTLTNNGTEPVNWTILQTEDWLEAIPYEGVLEPNEIIDVNVCISPEANLLDPNIYTEILIFQNLDSGSIKPRSITLTVKPPDCFTESFDVGENDLDFLSLTFSPDGSVAYYEACKNRIYEFPTDPNGGTYVPLWDDDFVEVVLSDGAEVLFYGQNYDRFYIGSNGYITFGDGDIEFSASLENHFNMPRISALFTDLDPPDDQCISYKQLDDRVVVTYQDVPLFGDKTAKNSFQIEVFLVDGTVCISWLKLAADASVAGLSEGKGLPPVFFVESNLTNYPPCWPWGDFNRDYSVNMNDLALFVLHWLDADCTIPYWCEKTDLDFSTEVEMVDFAIFADNWMVTEDWWLQPISHWKFDEGQGSIAYDSAGDNDGTIYGATWTTGQIDGALEFDGVDDYVDVGDPVDGSLDFGAGDSFSISAWIKVSKNTTILIKRRVVGGTYYEGYLLRVGRDYSSVYFAIEDTGSLGSLVVGETPLVDNEWHHVVAVRDTGKDKLYVYADGVSVATPVTDTTTATLATTQEFWIGRTPYYNYYFNGTIDDVRIYDRALSADEIWQLYWAGIGNKASHPNPANGAGDVDPNGLLSWSPGKDALSHDVYLGTDYNDVNDATPDSNEYMGNQDDNSYDPNGLDLLTTYFWRIDEIGASDTYKGHIWSFTTWQIEPEPDLVSWWKFDEGQGSIAYDSAGDNDGTIYGATWTTGQIDGALEFDGVDDYVDVGDPVDGSLDFGAGDSFSISAWVKPIENGPIVNKIRIPGGTFREGYFIRIANQIQFYIEDTGGARSSIIGNTALDDSNWYHVVGVRDTAEDKLYVYVDGLSDTTPVTDTTTTTLATTQDFWIGRMPYYNYYSNGTIDDVRIYDRALSPEEVWQLY